VAFSALWQQGEKERSDQREQQEKEDAQSNQNEEALQSFIDRIAELLIRIVDLIKPEKRRKAIRLKKSLSFCRDATLPH